MPTNNIKLLNAVKKGTKYLWVLTITTIIIPAIVGMLLMLMCNYTNTDITFNSPVTSYEVKTRKLK